MKRSGRGKHIKAQYTIKFRLWLRISEGFFWF